MRLGLSLPLALLLVGGAAPLSAVTLHLVKDIDPVPQPESSSPHDFENVLPGLAFFTADDGQTGDELWRTDGTPGGTFRLTDVCSEGCSSQPFFVGRSDRLYFFQLTVDFKQELWVTDGTPGGTLFLTSIVQLPGFGVWMPSHKLLYFAADDGIHGIELWRSDGTPGGTFLVTDLRPGPLGSNLSELTDVDGKLFFRADDGRGASLWTSDGTERGTRLVRNLAPSTNLPDPDPQPFSAAVGRTLYFTAPTPKHGVQLWRSDGTAKGTFSFTTFRTPTGSTPFLDVELLKNRLLFVANTKGPGVQLWTTDGTAKGTRMLTNFHPKSEQSLVIEALFGNRFVFTADDGIHGLEYWTTDGTPHGTALLKDLCPGSCSGSGFEAIQAGNLLYLTGTDDVHGQELWVSNGTAAGTHMVTDLCEGSCDSNPFGIRPAGGFVYFVADDGKNGRQVWRSDGTAPGTFPLTASVFGFNENVQGIVLGSVLVFAAPETLHGTELWRSDGTTQGTDLLADVNPADAGGSFPTDLAAVGNNVYFLAESSGLTGLWTSDGTAAGTVALAGPPQSQFSAITGFAGSPGSLFFVTTVPEESRPSLWRTDGTVSGTFRLSPDGVGAGVPTLVGNLAFFSAIDDDHGDELWVTDGTVAGTRLVADLEPGFPGSMPDNFTPFQGLLYFTALTLDGNRRQLWRSDGTEAGTVLVQDAISNPSSLTVHNDRLWFFAQDDEFQTNLWSTDGTAAGTRLAPLLPGPGSVGGGNMYWDGNRVFFSANATDLGSGLFVWDGTPGGLRHLGDVGIHEDFFDRAGGVVSNGVLYFSGTDSTLQNTLWASDGTEEGTRQVLNAAGIDIPDPHYFQAFAGSVYFTNQDNLLQTDGTAAGTVVLTRLAAPGESEFHELVAAGPRLFFRKWDPATGAELWALEAN